MKPALHIFVMLCLTLLTSCISSDDDKVEILDTDFPLNGRTFIYSQPEENINMEFTIASDDKSLQVKMIRTGNLTEHEIAYLEQHQISQFEIKDYFLNKTFVLTAGDGSYNKFTLCSEAHIFSGRYEYGDGDFENELKVRQCLNAAINPLTNTLDGKFYLDISTSNWFSNSPPRELSEDNLSNFSLDTQLSEEQLISGLWSDNKFRRPLRDKFLNSFAGLQIILTENDIDVSLALKEIGLKGAQLQYTKSFKMDSKDFVLSYDKEALFNALSTVIENRSLNVEMQIKQNGTTAYTISISYLNYIESSSPNYFGALKVQIKNAKNQFTKEVYLEKI